MPAMSDDNPLRGPSVRGIPEGDNRERMICTECGYILYDNPKIVVGSVARWGERILLVRRSIEPRYGYWTLPAGFLELNESATAGAEREAWEEARARIEIEGLLAIYDIPRISQVQLIYRARLLDEAIQAGHECLEVCLFSWEEIPWPKLAFPSVGWALQQDREARATRDFTARINPPGY
jgi:ADP-ribose pyrophosphatase YjhB (NUDIX family)